MLDNMQNHTAIVTGACGGIGAATTRRLCGLGVNVVALDLDPHRLAELEEGITNDGGNVVILAGDVTDENIGKTAVQIAQDRFGSPDILINNAGMGSAMESIWEIDIRDWRRDIELNLTSYFMMIQATVPHMIERGYGRIVNTASAAGMEGHALAGGYAAAKAGVVALTKVLGKELAKQGVIVNAVAPALIGSGMLDQPWFSDDVKKTLLDRIPMGRVGEPEEVAEMITFLASPSVSFSTGAVFDLSGGRATY